MPLDVTDGENTSFEMLSDYFATMYLLSSKLSAMNVLNKFLKTYSINFASVGVVFGESFICAPSGPIGGTLNLK